MLNKRITFGGEIIPAWIASPPKYIRPKRKMTAVQIPGSNREAIQMEDAFEPYDQPYVLFFGDGTENNIQETLDEICRNLYQKGWQVLMDDYDTDHFRLAYFKGDFKVENRFTRAGKFEIEFRCRPERFLLSGNIEVPVSSGDILLNPTAYEAKPLIHITGTGDGTLTVAGTTMEFEDISDYLNIDCDKMDVFRLPSENRNSLMTGDFPRLASGENIISYTGGIETVTITPRFWII